MSPILYSMLFAILIFNAKASWQVVTPLEMKNPDGTKKKSEPTRTVRLQFHNTAAMLLYWDDPEADQQAPADGAFILPLNAECFSVNPDGSILVKESVQVVNPNNAWHSNPTVEDITFSVEDFNPETAQYSIQKSVNLLKASPVGRSTAQLSELRRVCLMTAFRASKIVWATELVSPVRFSNEQIRTTRGTGYLGTSFGYEVTRTMVLDLVGDVLYCYSRGVTSTKDCKWQLDLKHDEYMAVPEYSQRDGRITLTNVQFPAGKLPYPIELRQSDFGNDAKFRQLRSHIVNAKKSIQSKTTITPLAPETALRESVSVDNINDPMAYKYDSSNGVEYPGTWWKTEKNYK